jgi:tRNA (cmo5U34)-methyltransferase
MPPTPPQPTPPKSTPEQIRARFDNDVERFSNLETGQAATMDAPLAMELVAQAAAASTPDAMHVLDVGCGAGNYTLKLLQLLPNLDSTLIDLSGNMLTRAKERVSVATCGDVRTIMGDIRELHLGEQTVDIILAAAVLHHLRTDQEWHDVFTKFHRALHPNGSIWIFDYVEHELPAVQKLMRNRHGEYLVNLNGPAYRDKVFAYIEEEDTPKSVTFQMRALAEVGFVDIDILHKNSCFAVFGATKR